MRVLIGIYIVFVVLFWISIPAEASVLTSNLEALDSEEINIEDICNQAGGICHISAKYYVEGITFSINE